jgi:sulfotransferase
MVEKIFFQSSLPRSGSTLLQNVLAQNPDIYSTSTSGICEVLMNARQTITNSIEFLSQDQKIVEIGQKGFYKESIFGYYNNITNRKYVIEKSRGWGACYEFVDHFYPNPKMIVMVRDLRAIVSSLEKKFRQNPHIATGIQNWVDLQGTTVDKRVDLFLTKVPPLSAPLDIIYDIILRKISKNLLFIRFEDFCVDPEKEIQKIYKYLEISYYKHDFNNIEQFTKENDAFHRPFGDHEIRSKIEPVKEDYVRILGSHNCDYIKNKYQWYYTAFKY